MRFFAKPSSPFYGSSPEYKTFKDAKSWGEECFPDIGYAVYCELPNGRILVYAYNFTAHGAGEKRISKELDMTEANKLHQQYIDSL